MGCVQGRVETCPGSPKRPAVGGYCERLTRNNSTLHCFLLNSRSVSNKIEHLRLFLDAYYPDMIFITETWLSSKISSSEIIGDSPYKLFRADRSGRRGGGICCIVKDCINLTEYALPSRSNLKSDILVLDAFDSSSEISLRLVLVYRPPNSTLTDDESLRELLFELCLYESGVVVLGDFNLDVDWAQGKANNFSSKKFVETFDCCKLFQYVTSPTRGDSVLDLILASIPCVHNVSILPPLGNSDHNIVSFQLKAPIAVKNHLPLPNFNKADYSGLSFYLSSVNWWETFQNYTSVEDVYKRFCRVLYSGFAIHVPFSDKDEIKSYYPRHISNLLAQKTRLFHSLRDPLSHRKYKRVSSELEFHLKRFSANKIKRANKLQNGSKVFSILKSRLKKTNKSYVLTDDGGNRLVSDAEKAEALAGFFVSVFNSGPERTSCDFLNETMNSDSMHDLLIRPRDVLRVLKTLKKSTSATFDGIPQIVYKKCANSLCKPLSIIFNISLMFNEVPSIWKEAIITAIPKDNSARCLSSFRPNSITPPSIKVLEKLLRDKISCHFAENHTIPAEQHGFTAGASTITQLADCYFDWYLAMNRGHSVDVIYFDLSKAFDKVNHEKLLYKLYHLGIKGTLLLWISSYLSDRHMCVKVGNSFSTRYLCTSGLPQGGVLSPLLFLAYTYDLPEKLFTSPSVKVQIFADDVKVYGIYNAETQTEVQQALSQSISNMMEWATAWDIPVNLSKTSVMHLGCTPCMEYRAGDILLKTSYEVRDLGIILTPKLDFKSHINDVIRRAFSTLFAILRNVQCNDASILIKLYKTYIIPILEYGSQIWNPYTLKQIRQIEKVQMVFTKILMYRCLPDPGFPQMLPSYSERLRIFHLRSLHYRRIFCDLVFCFKIIKGEAKLRPSKYWVFIPSFGRVNSFSLRTLRLHRTYQTKIYSTFFFRAARWLQMLPPSLLEAPTSAAFRRKLREVDLVSILNLPSIY